MALTLPVSGEQVPLWSDVAKIVCTHDTLVLYESILHMVCIMQTYSADSVNLTLASVG